MKKIFIIHTGGTFGMIPEDPEQTLHPGQIHNSIEAYVPQLRDIANIDIEIPFNFDSADVGPEHWTTLYKLISEKMEDYDGFVIIHGTDTLIYTAAALSFLFFKLKKPVILTGAQRPLSELRTDARSNLINSVELATMPVPEVAIFFGNRLFRGNRTKKISIESYQGFKSPNYPPLAEVGLNINLIKKNILSGPGTLPLSPDFDDRIVAVKIFPGLQSSFFEEINMPETRAIIIEAFGSGNFPQLKTGWFSFIKNAVKSDKIVIIGSQSYHGTVDLRLYESSRKALDAGVISMGNMTLETAIVKLMLLLGNFSDPDKIKRLFQADLAGELE